MGLSSKCSCLLQLLPALLIAPVSAHQWNQCSEGFLRVSWEEGTSFPASFKQDKGEDFSLTPTFSCYYVI